MCAPLGACLATGILERVKRFSCCVLNASQCAAACFNSSGDHQSHSLTQRDPLTQCGTLPQRDPQYTGAEHDSDHN